MTWHCCPAPKLRGTCAESWSLLAGRTPPPARSAGTPRSCRASQHCCTLSQGRCCRQSRRFPEQESLGPTYHIPTNRLGLFDEPAGLGSRFSPILEVFAVGSRHPRKSCALVIPAAETHSSISSLSSRRSTSPFQEVSSPYPGTAGTPVLLLYVEVWRVTLFFPIAIRSTSRINATLTPEFGEHSLNVLPLKKAILC